MSNAMVPPPQMRAKDYRIQYLSYDRSNFKHASLILNACSGSGQFATLKECLAECIRSPDDDAFGHGLAALCDTAFPHGTQVFEKRTPFSASLANNICLQLAALGPKSTEDLTLQEVQVLHIAYRILVLTGMYITIDGSTGFGCKLEKKIPFEYLGLDGDVYRDYCNVAQALFEIYKVTTVPTFGYMARRIGHGFLVEIKQHYGITASSKVGYLTQLAYRAPLCRISQRNHRRGDGWWMVIRESTNM